MPDIGLNLPSSGDIHSFAGVATVAGIRFRYVVVSAGTGDRVAVALPARAAAAAVMGICDRSDGADRLGRLLD
jgi:hypothetical protein